MQTPKEVIRDWNEQVGFHPVSDRESNNRKWLKEYHNYNRKMCEKLRIALANENGLIGHPKEEKLFEIIWNEYHSCVSDIPGYYSEFAILLK